MLLIVVLIPFSFSLALAAGDGESSAVGASGGASVLKMGRFQVPAAELTWLLVQPPWVVPGSASSECHVQDFAAHVELVKAGLQMLFPFRAEIAQSVQAWSCEHGVSSQQAFGVGLGL